MAKAENKVKQPRTIFRCKVQPVAATELSGRLLEGKHGILTFRPGSKKLDSDTERVLSQPKNRKGVYLDRLDNIGKFLSEADEDVLRQLARDLAPSRREALMRIFSEATEEAKNRQLDEMIFQGRKATIDVARKWLAMQASNSVGGSVQSSNKLSNIDRELIAAGVKHIRDKFNAVVYFVDGKREIPCTISLQSGSGGSTRFQIRRAGTNGESLWQREALPLLTIH